MFHSYSSIPFRNFPATCVRKHAKSRAHKIDPAAARIAQEYDSLLNCICIRDHRIQ